MQIDDIARAMSKDKNMKSFVSAFKKDTNENYGRKKVLGKGIAWLCPTQKTLNLKS